MRDGGVQDALSVLGEDAVVERDGAVFTDNASECGQGNSPDYEVPSPHGSVMTQLEQATVSPAVMDVVFMMKSAADVPQVP